MTIERNVFFYFGMTAVAREKFNFLGQQFSKVATRFSKEVYLFIRRQSSLHVPLKITMSSLLQQQALCQN